MILQPLVGYACAAFMYGPQVPGWKGAPAGQVDTLKRLLNQPTNVIVAAPHVQFPKTMVWVEVGGNCRGYVYRWPSDSVVQWRVVQYMPGGSCGGVEFDLSRLPVADKRRKVPVRDRNVAVRWLWANKPKHFWTQAEMPCAFQ